MKNKLILINDVTNNLEKLIQCLNEEDEIDLIVLTSLEELASYRENKILHMILMSAECENILPSSVFKKIRSCDTTKFLPILYINKKDDKKDIREAYEAGVNECINMPFSIDELILRIKSHIVNYQTFKRCLIQNERLFTIVSTDSLTKVSSRMHLQTIILQSIKEYKRYDRLFSLICIQPEGISKYNLLNGFSKGDQLLKNIAKSINYIIRESDILARYSGSEFIIFMPKSNIENAGILVKKINKYIQKENFSKILKIRLNYGATQVKKEDTMYSVTDRVNKALQSSIDTNSIYTTFL
ncbi:MAG: diguanylate cyclase [Sulfurimonas sp.]|nr:diguanylate cyclase [Sulfurimonas sp.]